MLPNGVGLYCSWNVDNGGPLTEAGVTAVYRHVRQMYPDAHVHASTFDEFADAITPDVRAQLPVVTREIGDTWLYGNPSDQLKNVQFREMSRLRRACVEVSSDHSGGCSCGCCDGRDDLRRNGVARRLGRCATAMRASVVWEPPWELPW